MHKWFEVPEFISALSFSPLTQMETWKVQAIRINSWEFRNSFLQDSFSTVSLNVFTSLTRNHCSPSRNLLVICSSVKLNMQKMHSLRMLHCNCKQCSWGSGRMGRNHWKPGIWCEFLVWYDNWDELLLGERILQIRGQN